MEQQNDGFKFEERDVERLVAEYGKKPPSEVRETTMKNLESQREKFRRLEEFKARNQDRSQGRSP